MEILSQIIFLIITYLIAAIPFGFVLAKQFAGKDITKLGSKNIGATNVTRVVGRKLGFATLLLDSLKGALMVIIARFVFGNLAELHLFLVLVAIAAVLGHIFPIYLKFKGGKGVATGLATLFALDPTVGALALCIWIISFVFFRISSLSSLVAIFSSIIFSSYYQAPTIQVIFCLLLFVLILIRHKENILRLLSGKEKKL